MPPLAQPGLPSMSKWSHVPLAPADPILGLNALYSRDADPRKVNLGVGAYKGEDGKPYVLPSVKKAIQKIVNSNHEYLPITGLPEFTLEAKKLIFGPDRANVEHKNVTTIQSLSGTGALRLAAAFLNRFHVPVPVYVPDPTWGNHYAVFRDAGFREIRPYKYYARATNTIDFKGMLSDISNAQSNSIVLLHACAHNPTGLDPNHEQWRELSQLLSKKGHTVLMDCAYQGFASGNPETDVESIRTMLRDGHQLLVAQSFAKNFGLYGERIGALSLVCRDEPSAKAVQSQVSLLARAMYSNPPAFGARIVHAVLSDAELSAMWRVDVRGMADRIHEMRRMLVDKLSQGGRRDWSHILRQIGMFSYTGLSKEETRQMVNTHHIYMTADGRISLAGLNTRNVDYVARCMLQTTGAC
eukprot:TRINITY_DN8895_c0_g1_i2.p2 TRINITY_DN8895_c0_g1~~TRINITY_DN8895_c0_g1_i2.p2  ORF type:complete len:412 (-),score=107.00 TRINITY_DN8895_c0_g1_i2:60-1295(-)